MSGCALQGQGAVNLTLARKTKISIVEWGFGNEFTNFCAESALHFRKLIATI